MKKKEKSLKKVTGEQNLKHQPVPDILHYQQKEFMERMSEV